MSPFGYKRRFGPRRWYDRSTPESRPSSGNIRFAPNFVCFTPRNRSTGSMLRESGFDPKQPCGPLRRLVWFGISKRTFGDEERNDWV